MQPHSIVYLCVCSLFKGLLFGYVSCYNTCIEIIILVTNTCNDSVEACLTVFILYVTNALIL